MQGISWLAADSVSFSRRTLLHGESKMTCFVFYTYFTISNIIFLTNFLRYSQQWPRNPLSFVHSVFQLLVHNFNSVNFVIFFLFSLYLMQNHAHIFCAVLSVFLSELKRISLQCQTPFPQNRFCSRFHSSGMCHAFKYLTDFNELKLKLLH